MRLIRLGYVLLATSAFVLLLSWPSTVVRAAADKSGVDPRVISLPSGPGSIEGLGESFEPQLNSGTSSYRIPLRVPPGRAGFAPELRLTYSSGRGNGPFGLGWSLDFPYLEIQTDKGMPRYKMWPAVDGVDKLVYRGSEELVPVSASTWRLKIEGEFTVVEQLPAGWRARRSDGAVMEFGLTAASRVEDAGREFRWNIERMADPNGNQILFEYEKLGDGRLPYLTRIVYSGDDPQAAMSVVLQYESRPDTLTDYRPTFELTTAYRCTAIEMRAAGALVRRYRLAYAPVTAMQAMSLLAQVRFVARDGTSELPPATFGYQAFDSAAAVPRGLGPVVNLANADIDFLDINADGLPDFLDTRFQPHSYRLNLGPDASGDPRWAAPEEMTSDIAYGLASSAVRLADMDADGRADLVRVASDTLTYFQVVPGLAWEQAGVMEGAGFSFTDSRLQFFDANGDKHMDVLRTRGDWIDVFLNLDGSGWSSSISEPSPNASLQLALSSTKLADMNGDRLLDLVFLTNSSLSYYPNMGFGRFGDRIEFLDPPTGLSDYSRLLLMDVNGDGRSDGVYVGNGTVTVWISHGLSTDHAKAEFAQPFVIRSVLLGSASSFRPLDVNGNGSVDLVWNTSVSGQVELAYVDFAPGEQPYQLKTITNGIGRTTTIQYRSSVVDMTQAREVGQPWSQVSVTPVQVVASIQTSDGLQTYSTEFGYRDAYYDSVEKEFRGFAGATQRESGDASVPDLITEFAFDTGATEEARKGKLLALVAKNAAGNAFFTETHSWTTRSVATPIPQESRTVTFAFESAMTRTVSELGNGTPVTLAWEYDYDNYGNRTRMLEYGRLDPGWGDERLTVSSYTAASDSGQEHWILDRLVEQTVSDGNGGLAAATRNFYDQSTTAGEVSAGNLTRVEQWVGGEQWQVTTRNDYDTWGNIIATYDGLYGSAAGHYRQFVYDPEFHTFPVQEIVHTGGTVSSLTMHAAYDPGLGVMTSTTDFNGFTTRYGYDTFGRLTAIVKPGDAADSPTVSYGYVLNQNVGGGRTVNWVDTRQRESAGGGTVDARSFFDGLGRKIMTRAEGESAGQIVVSDTVQFNARKMPVRKYLPYFDSGGLGFAEPSFSGSYTAHLYDALGREVRMTQPDGTHSITEYRPFRRIVRDEEQTRAGSPHEGGSMQYVSDGLLDQDGAGRLREVVEPPGWTTRYRYDVLDNLTGYTDAQANQKSIVFDGLSRKTFMDDPDRGRWSYVYDDADNLVRTTDARGQVIGYQYDGANRLLAEFYGPPGSAPDVQYHYDIPAGPQDLGEFWGQDQPQAIAQAILTGENVSPADDRNGDGVVDAADVVQAARGSTSPSVQAANAKGRLAWVQDLSGEEHTSYDSRGRVAWTIKRIRDDGGTLKNFFTGTTYDSMDRMVTLTYPDQTKLDHQYNGRGLPEAMPGVVTAIDYNPAGERALLALANGVSTTYDYDLRLRLHRLHSVRSSDGLALQDFAYTYDAVSNITRITDQRSKQALDTIGTELGITAEEARKFNGTQDFTYDAVYRLTQAKNDAVWGRLDWQYDAIGNMTRQDAALSTPDPQMQLGTISHGGAGGSTGRIGRPNGAAPGPHALTGTANSDFAAIGYDANGNVTSQDGATLTWDVKDRLVGFEKEAVDATYVYDFKGQRVRKHGAALEEAIYIGKNAEIRSGLLVKYAYSDGDRIARSAARSAAFTAERYFSHDHLGSTNIVGSISGLALEQIVNFPFGKSRVSRGTSPLVTNYQFTGNELDRESDLTYFGQRYQVGVLAQFASTDPAIVNNVTSAQLSNPQNWSPYSYALNRPVIAIDENGEVVNLAAAGIGALVGAAVNMAFYAATHDMSQEGAGKGLMGAATSGLITGGVAGLTMGVNLVGAAVVTGGRAIAVNLAAGAVGEGANQAITGKWDAGKIAISGVTNVVGGEVGGMVASRVTQSAASQSLRALARQTEARATWQAIGRSGAPTSAAGMAFYRDLVAESKAAATRLTGKMVDTAAQLENAVLRGVGWQGAVDQTLNGGLDMAVDKVRSGGNGQ